MTICNVMLTGAGAVLFADTALCDREGNIIGHTSKLEALPHLHAGFAMRGLHGLHTDARRYLQAGGCGSFRDALAGLPDVLADSSHALAALLASHGDQGAAGGFPDGELTLAGLDPATGRVRAVRYASANGFEPEELAEGVYLAPPPAEGVTMPRTMTIEQAIGVAQAQRAMMAENAREAGGGVGIGGLLQAMEITAEAIRLRTIHRFEEAAHVIAA
ncbi:hypothetical protein [Oceanibaculum sp.]|uniref:hypothetical protein n=1 Tax=Oceanibaculum sp. TaxID=1903597 RepID=UPI002587F638|nr:hypothetical protein [Oceanibaculum sp.]MCH2393217.1 hypothetical protein [Oceanibaculum sp.]